MNDIAVNGFALKRNSDTPLFIQLCDNIRQQIVQGKIEEGYRLPASRSLATEMGVSRTTVVSAYEQLVAEGYLEGRRGAGYYVCAIGDTELIPARRSDKPTPVCGENRTLNSNPGLPDMRLFPYRQWARCVARTARLHPQSLVISDDLFGDYDLRQSIARYLADWRGLAVSPEQVVITAGANDALETCLRTLAETERPVGLEDPGYPPFRRLVSSMGFSPYWLRMGKGGAQVPRAKKTGRMPGLLMLTPSQHFPLGGAMPQKRRLEFLQWAEQHNAWIIEDDYDSEFRYAGWPIPTLMSGDTTGRTIYLGSFSKVFSWGLRLGYMVVPSILIRQFAITRRQYVMRASVSAQRPLAAFIDSGEFYRHIRRVRRIYAERRKCLINCLHNEFGDLITFKNHQAGMQISIQFSQAVDDCEIAEQAQKSGFVVEALSNYYAQPEQHKRGLLLGFCAYTEDEIQNYVVTLRKAVERCLICD